MSYEQFRPRGFSVLPEVVKNLLIINGLFFLATWAMANSFGADLVEMLGLHYYKSEYFRPYQFVTHLFMHGGMSHIFFNMFALWMFGSALENYWGGKRFLIYYMVTGFGAAIIHTAYTTWDLMNIEQAIAAFEAAPSPELLSAFINDHVPSGYQQSFNELLAHYQVSPDSLLASDAAAYMHELLKIKMDVPTVGASGAVFGVLLAFGMMFPDSLIYLYFFFPIKAKYFVVLYGALELYSAVQNDPNNNVAHFAHLGGMVFGFILIRYWRSHNTRF